MSDFVNTIDLLGDDAVADGIIERTITEFKDDKLETIGGAAFQNCTMLTTVDCPSVKAVFNSGFQGCTALTTANFPQLESVSQNGFNGCANLTSIDIPNVTSLQVNAFAGSGLQAVRCPSLVSTGFHIFSSCKNLKTADLCVLRNVNAHMFYNCTSFVALIIHSTNMCSLNATSALEGTPIASGTGYIYVPRDLIDSYKTATNWSTYVDQFRALEDYTVDGTVTGDLDETKI